MFEKRELGHDEPDEDREVVVRVDLVGDSEIVEEGLELDIVDGLAQLLELEQESFPVDFTLNLLVEAVFYRLIGLFPLFGFRKIERELVEQIFVFGRRRRQPPEKVGLLELLGALPVGLRTLDDQLRFLIFLYGPGRNQLLFPFLDGSELQSMVEEVCQN